MRTYLKVALIVVAVISFGILVKFMMIPMLFVNSATNVVAKTVDANHVLQSYEWFYDVDAQVKSRTQQIEGHMHLVMTEADPEERRRLRLELAAMQQSCRDLTSKYNANSEKMNKGIFRNHGLPASIDMMACEVK